MSAKEDILDLLQELPDHFTFDEAVVRLSKLYAVPLNVEHPKHGRKDTPGATFPLKKAQVIESFQRLPDGLPHDETIDEALYWLYVIFEVEQGLEEVNRGEGIPHEEAMKRLANFRKLQFNGVST